MDGIPCKYLGDGFCTIWETRLGADLGNGYVCGMRDDLHKNFPGCPYNRIEWANRARGPKSEA
tara:strand:+ start:1457 stop:1645 length:189 start_codon:yes stop_codon:yes gene_type:complete